MQILFNLFLHFGHCKSHCPCKLTCSNKRSVRYTQLYTFFDAGFSQRLVLGSLPSRRLCSSAQSTHTRKQKGGAHEEEKEEKEEKEKTSLIKEQRLVHEQITFINSRPSNSHSFTMGFTVSGIISRLHGLTSKPHGEPKWLKLLTKSNLCYFLYLLGAIIWCIVGSRRCSS